MKVITKNGWFKPDGTMFHRLEPWTTPQDLEDDMFDVLPSAMIIVVPPAGYRFKKGIEYSGGDFQPNVPFTGQAVGADARWPTKVDVELIPDDDEDELSEAEIEAIEAASVAEAEAQKALQAEADAAAQIAEAAKAEAAEAKQAEIAASSKAAAKAVKAAKKVQAAKERLRQAAK